MKHAPPSAWVFRVVLSVALVLALAGWLYAGYIGCGTFPEHYGC